LGGEVQELTGAINDIMAMYNFLVALPAVDLLVHLRMPGVGGFAKAKRKVDAVVYRMIEAHRQRAKVSGDLLDMMLHSEEDFPSDSGTPNESLRDQVITIFLAGYETVANALIWTWYLLSQHPEAEWKLHEEIDRELGQGDRFDPDSFRGGYGGLDT
jgi:cytochrome P450